MEGYLTVLAFAMLPALGNFAGGVLAEVANPSRRVLSLALHLAAGIVIAVVAVELMPQALSAKPQWAVILSFVLGAAFFVTVDWAIERWSARARGASRGVAADLEGERAEGGSGPWIIFFGVAIDLFSDGVMIGAGSSVGLALGLLLALGQVPADIPEGFATIANFRGAGVARRTRLLLSAAFAVPILLGATISYFVLRGQPELYKLMLLTFTAGVLTTLVIEELVPEAHEEAADTRLAPLVFAAGFALFALISAYLEIE